VHGAECVAFVASNQICIGQLRERNLELSELVRAFHAEFTPQGAHFKRLVGMPVEKGQDAVFQVGNGSTPSFRVE